MIISDIDHWEKLTVNLKIWGGFSLPDTAQELIAMSRNSLDLPMLTFPMGLSARSFVSASDFGPNSSASVSATSSSFESIPEG